MVKLINMRFIFILSLAANVSACVHDHVLARRAAQAGTPSFGYTGRNGPLNWYGLDSQANSECDLGRHQSPVMVDSKTAEILEPHTIQLDIPDAEHVEFENLGYTLEVILTNGTLVAKDHRYTLTQFHFHTPSEHRFDEEYFPLEVHFVFKDDASAVAVLGFVFQLSECGACEPLFEDVFTDLEEVREPGSSSEIESLNFSSLLQHLQENKVYTYGGSLTTPPCSEGVTWFISAEPLELDVHHYNQLKSIMKFNSRYTQNVLDDENLLELAADGLHSIN